jgi:RNA polymerase sigma factor (sigma-70 family)
MQSESRGRLETAYRQHGARLWQAIVLSTGDPDVASEAVAEAFARALRRGDAIRSPEAWVWRVAFRLAWRDLKNRRDHKMGAAQTQDFPTETIELRDALLRLPRMQRAAIVLQYLGGYSHREIARALRSTPAAIAVHVHRGRQRLRKELGVRDD